jgi:RNA-binding protein
LRVLEDGDAGFSAAEINIIIHATENENKILQSVNDVLLIPVQKFSTISSNGHFRNKILLLRANILDSQQANFLALKIISSLKDYERNQFMTFLEEYTDEKGNLYIRLDKQRICRGKVSLSESDSIKIRFRPFRKYRAGRDIVQGYRRLLSLGV